MEGLHHPSYPYYPPINQQHHPQRPPQPQPQSVDLVRDLPSDFDTLFGPVASPVSSSQSGPVPNAYEQQYSYSLEEEDEGGYETVREEVHPRRRPYQHFSQPYPAHYPPAPTHPPLLTRSTTHPPSSSYAPPSRLPSFAPPPSSHDSYPSASALDVPGPNLAPPAVHGWGDDNPLEGAHPGAYRSEVREEDSQSHHAAPFASSAGSTRRPISHQYQQPSFGPHPPPQTFSAPVATYSFSNDAQPEPNYDHATSPPPIFRSTSDHLPFTSKQQQHYFQQHQYSQPPPSQFYQQPYPIPPCRPSHHAHSSETIASAASSIGTQSPYTPSTSVSSLERYGQSDMMCEEEDVEVEEEMALGVDGAATGPIDYQPSSPGLYPSEYYQHPVEQLHPYDEQHVPAQQHLQEVRKSVHLRSPSFVPYGFPAPHRPALGPFSDTSQPPSQPTYPSHGPASDLSNQPTPIQNQRIVPIPQQPQHHQHSYAAHPSSLPHPTDRDESMPYLPPIQSENFDHQHPLTAATMDMSYSTAPVVEDNFDRPSYQPYGFSPTATTFARSSSTFVRASFPLSNASVAPSVRRDEPLVDVSTHTEPSSYPAFASNSMEVQRSSTTATFDSEPPILAANSTMPSFSRSISNQSIPSAPAFAAPQPIAADASRPIHPSRNQSFPPPAFAPSLSASNPTSTSISTSASSSSIYRQATSRKASTSTPSSRSPEPSLLHRRRSSAAVAASSDKLSIFTTGLVTTTAPLPALPPIAKGNAAAGSTKKRILHPTRPYAVCSGTGCGEPIAKLFLRGEREAFDVPWEGWWFCSSCVEKEEKAKKEAAEQERLPAAAIAPVPEGWAPPLATFLPNAVVNSSLPAPSGYYQPPPIPTTNADSSASPSSSTSTLPKPSAKAIPAPTTRKSKRAEVVGGKASFLAARRKRNREAQDTNAPLTCDVCLKEKGRGGIVPVEREGTIEFSVEFVCIDCEDKYRRCTDCGGGGGGRVGIGKWRCKEVFRQNRKTCSLSHTRIGNAPLGLGVWEVSEIPDGTTSSLNFTSTGKGEGPEVDEVEDVKGELIKKCEALWEDRMLSRLAIPEVLETTLSKTDGMRTFEHIQQAIEAGWPSKKKILEARDAHELNVSRRYIGLSWIKSRPRRGGAPESPVEEPDENSIFATTEIPNLKPVNTIIPEGSELTQLWVGDWAMLNGTLLITTALPFDGTDGDDRATMAVGEIICRIIAEIADINAQRKAASRAPYAPPPQLLPPLLHVWCISDGSSPLIREKMQDILARRRQFLPLDEYLKKHPDVDPVIFADWPGPRPGPGWAQGGGVPATILVRWLGEGFDRQALEQMAGSEFGKKSKKKKV